ncbi:MAG: hypothetical protein Aurels2KO_26220 [Aureliella sp.]
MRSSTNSQSNPNNLVAQAAVIGLLVLVACGLLAVWWVLNPTKEVRPEHVSVLEAPIDEDEFKPDASATELLDLADRTVLDLIEQFPESPRAHNVKANRDYLVSDTESAKASWTRAAELDPTSSDALFGLAMIAFEENRYEESIEVCEVLDRIDSDNPRVPLLLADAFLHNGQADEAALTLEQHISTEQASVQALEMLGNAYLNKQDYSPAVAAFQRAIEYSPDSKDAHYGLAQAYARSGDRDNAKIYMDRFQQIAKALGDEHSEDAKDFEDRDYAAHVAAQAYVDSANVFREQELIDKACDYLLRAQRLQPDVIPWLTELQELLYKAQRYEDAIDVGQRLVQLQPENVDQWINLGLLNAELQRSSESIEAYRRAVAIAPDDPRCVEAKKIIERLEAS